MAIVVIALCIIGPLILFGLLKGVPVGYRMLLGRKKKAVEAPVEDIIKTVVESKSKYGLSFNIFDVLEEKLPAKPEYTNWTISTANAASMHSIVPEAKAVKIAEPNDVILTITLMGNNAELTEYFNLTRYEKQPELKTTDEFKALASWARNRTQMFEEQLYGYHSRPSHKERDETSAKLAAFEESWKLAKEVMKKEIADYNAELLKQPIEIRDYLTMAEQAPQYVQSTIMKPILKWANEAVKEYRLKYATVEHELKII